jgi:hypothetical protein
VLASTSRPARRRDARRCEQSVNNLPPGHEETPSTERHHRAYQSENNFQPNTGHHARSRPSYRHKEPASPGTCIGLRTRRSQVRVLQGAPNQQLTATRFRARTSGEQFVRDGVQDGASSQIAGEEIGRIPRRLLRGVVRTSGRKSNTHHRCTAVPMRCVYPGSRTRASASQARHPEQQRASIDPTNWGRAVTGDIHRLHVSQ